MKGCIDGNILMGIFAFVNFISFLSLTFSPFTAIKAVFPNLVLTPQTKA